MKACRQLCPWNTIYGCHKPENEPCILSNMPCEKFEKKPMTNADHIRSMTDEELAKRIMHLNFCPPNIDEYKECGKDANCHQCWVDWLRKPYKEDT